MLAHALRRFQPFGNLDAQLLARLAQQARVLTLAADRWLVRPGRSLPGSYYLLRGRVRSYRPDAEIDARDERARQPIVPGPAAIKTLVTSSVLALEPRAAQLVAEQELFAGDSRPLQRLVPEPLPGGWEHRFVTHQVVTLLGPQQWQVLLRHMRAQRFATGQAVVEQGQRATDFFVLGAGRAEVVRDGRCVARLEPGDFFGEEALVLGAERNATVTMTAVGTVMGLSGEAFLEQFLAVLLTRFCAHQTRETLRVGSERRPGIIALAELRQVARRLAQGRCYEVLARQPAEAVLGAFLLVQAGHCAAPAPAALASFTPR